MCAQFFSATPIRNIFHSDKYLAIYAQKLADTHADLHVKFSSLISDVNKNLRISTNLSNTSEYNIL
jgi:hypothetical protein